MKNFTLLFLSCLLLTGCFFRTHKMDVEQGNIITSRNARALHKGMTSEQVRSVMGNPVLVNVFSPGRMEYIYTYQAGYGNMNVRRVICIFQNGIVREIYTLNV